MLAAWQAALPALGAGSLLARPAQIPTSQADTTRATGGWTQWVESARQRALEHSDRLPDFICTQLTRRYTALESETRWRPLDFWEAELSYNQKNERYSQLRVNGKPVSKPLEKLEGALSIGEFGSTLRTLFLPETQARFWKQGEEEIGGIPVVVVGFAVEQEHSRWTLAFKSTHSLNVAYAGRAWVEAASHQVLRISQHTLQLPPKFPIAYSETTTEYGYTTIPGLGPNPYLLPKAADLILQERQPAVRLRNVIEFRNYRKFTAEVRLVPE